MVNNIAFKITSEKRIQSGNKHLILKTIIFSNYTNIYSKEENNKKKRLPSEVEIAPPHKLLTLLSLLTVLSQLIVKVVSMLFKKFYQDCLKVVQ